jgi:hypothetical protein
MQGVALGVTAPEAAAPPSETAGASLATMAPASRAMAAEVEKAAAAAAAAAAAGEAHAAQQRRLSRSSRGRARCERLAETRATLHRRTRKEHGKTDMDNVGWCMLF